MRVGQLRGVHASLLALIGAAMLVRALVPMGWMPVRTADGFTIQLCAGLTPGVDPNAITTANELLQAALAGAVQQQDDHNDRSDLNDQLPCTFAGLTPFAPPAGLATFVAPLPAAAPVQPLALTAAIGRGLPAPPPPATGPPLNA